MRAAPFLLLGGIAAACGATAEAPARQARTLLPDLAPQAPSELAVRAVDSGGERRYRIGFRSAADNVGPGPLIVVARRARLLAETMSTTQVLVRRDGSQIRRRLPARLHFVRSSDHSHWHYDAFMRYELRTADGATRLGRDNKTGFCLGDRYVTPPRTGLRAERGSAVFLGACGKGRPRLRRLRQGISVGYGDDYAPHLEGQEIDITDVPPGRYRLVHTVNPDRSLVERSYRNNASAVLIRISRPAGGAPVVRLLRSVGAR